jgi:hypothetical protein
MRRLDNHYEDLLRLRLKVARAELEHAKGNMVRATVALLIRAASNHCTHKQAVAKFNAYNKATEE